MYFNFTGFMKTSFLFLIFVFFLRLAEAQTDTVFQPTSNKLLLEITKLGKLGEAENFELQPTRIPYRNGFLSVVLSNNRTGVMHYIDPSMDRITEIPLRPLFDALGMGRRDLAYLDCITLDGDMIYFVGYLWIASAEIVGNQLMNVRTNKYSSSVVPRVATCSHGKLHCMGHVQWKGMYKAFVFDMKSLELEKEETLLDEQAIFCWCQPSRRYLPGQNGEFLILETTDYVIKSYSLENNTLDTMINQEWSAPFPNDFKFIIDDMGKSNCQRLSDSKHPYLLGATYIGPDTMLVFVGEEFRVKQRDTYVRKNGEWSRTNSYTINNEANKESYKTVDYMYHNAGLDVMGYYDKGYLYFVFFGPKKLPNGESYSDFQDRLYRYLKRKKGYIYLSKWKVEY